MRFCTGSEDCLNEAKEGDLCTGHARRKRRGATVSVELHTGRGARYNSPWERVTEAALAYAEGDAFNKPAFERLRKRLENAIVHYVECLPSRPCPTTGCTLEAKHPGPCCPERNSVR